MGEVCFTMGKQCDMIMLCSMIFNLIQHDIT